ncbi:tRNA (adenosine(37)-N6)-threonylcarbamoyltransferase complex ATPase subunit type 1 TsaE [Pontibacter sp. G13]|uniref:tRNA (adenosine(37)-N6)-threonylcarbamoyltransferase complex ATPase subunit type 1 TsaE n=1 Tax=Pontibacter sp. G13 TaxID=3074898 RepID=UPI002889654D|nr:tRNA (adenosine(37)-N6)-threonylcarbamoyltransferase complex ATPase subunit type 1 TsaE [Pontibacter sp. G13]WNJ18001.1 tRNA (adenosine(37)-N6)-threonylcarbamoyltransferase complex ATPase subunit type 1 TsaE [Pontibacter sp. G13]
MNEELYTSKAEADNLGIARQILEAASSSRVFALYGNLGAGKTTLVKRFCEVLGVTESVTSPTFTLVNEYQGEDGRVCHFDFYRIKSEWEAYDMGCAEYFDSGDYCFVEWPERVDSLLPPDMAQIHIESMGETERAIRLIF